MTPRNPFLDGSEELENILKKLESVVEPVAPKKTAAKKTPAKKAAAKPKSVELTEGELDLVRCPRIKGGFPTESVKLKGKDELLIVYCDACRCTHYYIAQPQADKPDRFNVHALLLGEEVCWVPGTPSGDMDTEAAMEHVEDEVGEH